MVDQLALDRLIGNAPKELELLNRSIDQLNDDIVKQTDLQNLYFSILDKPKNDLETRLAVKAAYWESGAWLTAWAPSHVYSNNAIVRPTVPNGRKYKAQTYLDPGNPAEPAWTLSTWYNSGTKVSGGGYNHQCSWTGWSGSTSEAYSFPSGWNTSVGGTTTDFETGQTWVNVGLIVAPAYHTGTSGVTEPTWPTTIGATVGENGWPADGGILWHCESTDVTKPNGGPDYSQYETDIVFRTDSYYKCIISHTATGGNDPPSAWWTLTGLTGPTWAGGTYYHNGYGNLTDWSIKVAGVIVYEYLGTGWDGDPIIIKAIDDWNANLPIFNPLIYGEPSGTKITISNLNSSLSSVTTRRNQVATRNLALASYKTYTIQASKDGPGTISPTGAVTVNAGYDQTFTFTGTVSKIVVDGVTLSSTPSSYTFAKVNQIHAIKVYFV